MVQKHYKNQLNAFIDHELPRDEQQQVAAHLMQCIDCRARHDRIKLGASLAGQMRRADAPPQVWGEIENALDDRRTPQMALISPGSYFGSRSIAGYAVGLLIVVGLVAAVYLTLFRSTPYEARNETDTGGETQTGQAPVPDLVELPNASPIDPNTAPANVDAPPGVQSAELTTAPGWQFETISGTPSVGGASSSTSLAVGDFLETDAASRARLNVADIGNVEIKPNSRVLLVGTNAAEHRLSLERGELHARISAPPRLFIVDTPSAVAVDLGCEYTLGVDKAGNSRLHVTSGFVALERGGRESIVPAGAVCITKRGKGLGTPFAADTSEPFRAALERFDFAGGGSRSLEVMLSTRSFYDMVTLWHLLPRVQKTDRAAVFDALSEYVSPPAQVNRDGILRLDKKMLAAWRTEVERVWFE